MLTSAWRVRQGGDGRTDRRPMVSFPAFVCWTVKQEHLYHSTPGVILARQMLHPLDQLYQPYPERL